MPASNFAKNKIANAIYKQTSFTAPAAIWLALFTTDPTAAGTGTEVSGGSYARVNITAAFGTVTNGAATNSSIVDFGIATAGWGTIGFWAIFDASSAGNMWEYGPVSVSQTISTGNSVRFQSGQISVSVT